MNQTINVNHLALMLLDIILIEDAKEEGL